MTSHRNILKSLDDIWGGVKDEEIRKRFEAHFGDERDFADDFSYILEQLEKNSRDYIKYFSPYKNSYTNKIQKRLITTLIGIKNDRYCIDIKTLEEDIKELVEIASMAETKLKNKGLSIST